MAHKIMTLCDGKDYFIHYYITDNSPPYNIQVSQFDKCGRLVARKKVFAANDYGEAYAVLEKLQNGGILPSQLDGGVILQ